MAYCSKGRVCINLKKFDQFRIAPQIEVTENFDFAAALESVYPLLELVFTFLDYKDLQNASQVNRSWELTAERILNKRKNVSWITVFRKKRQSYVQCSRNYPYNDISFGIILFNYRAVSLSDCFCYHEAFTARKIKFSEFLAEHVVPSGIEYCVIACPSVASLFSNDVINKSSVPLFDGCFIPHIPNVRISMFYCNPNQMRDDYIKSNEKLKCLLLFCKVDLGERIYDIIEHLLPEKGFSSVAIGGGIIQRTLIYPQPNNCYRVKKSNSLCIAFTEDSYNGNHFNASSVVISGNHLTSEDFENELIKFKRKIVIRNNSMAFRVCCAAKSRRKVHESKVFNKVFPQTPLLGLEAEGEIGWNCFDAPLDQDDLEVQKSKKSRRNYPTVQHQWSSVIVFITWGPSIQTT